MIDNNLISFLFDGAEDLFPDYFNNLEDAFFFNPQHISDFNSPIGKLTEEIFPQLPIPKRNKSEQKKIFLNSLLSNIALSFRRSLPVAIPKGNNYYSRDKFYGLNHYTATISRQILKELENLDYLQLKNGYHLRDKNRGRFTRIQPSEKLKQIFLVITAKEYTAFEIDENNIALIDPLKSEKKTLKRSVILKAQIQTNQKVKSKKKKRKQKEYPVKYELKTKIVNKIKFINRYNRFISKQEILFPINESFVLRLKDVDSRKNTLNFIEKLNFSLHTFSLQTNNINNIIQSINIIQQTSHTHIPNPLLRRINDKYLLYSKLDTKIHSIYHRGSLRKGGRFYGADYQALNEEQRNLILINGESVIELDYSGYHIRMIYHLDGIEYSADPYDLFNGNTELRDLMKLVSLVGVNAMSKGRAVNGINQSFYKDPKLKAITKKYNYTAKDLIKHFQQQHSQIEKHFFSDMGVNLMYKDSLIAEDILRHFLNKKIPCLCIHDSFIVPEKYKDELHQIMRDTYFKHLKFYPVIK